VGVCRRGCTACDTPTPLVESVPRVAFSFWGCLSIADDAGLVDGLVGEADLIGGRHFPPVWKKVISLASGRNLPPFLRRVVFVGEAPFGAGLKAMRVLKVRPVVSVHARTLGAVPWAYQSRCGRSLSRCLPPATTWNAA